MTLRYAPSDDTVPTTQASKQSDSQKTSRRVAAVLAAVVIALVGAGMVETANESASAGHSIVQEA